MITIKTVPFGDTYEPYMGVPDDEYDDTPHCACCGDVIRRGEEYYDLGDNKIYCTSCEATAVDLLLESHLATM